MFWKTAAQMLKPFLPRRLSLRLTLLYAAVFSIVLILLNAGTLYGIRYFLIRQAETQVQSCAESTLKEAGAVKGKIGVSDASLLGEAEAAPGISILITDASGKRLAHSGHIPSGWKASAQYDSFLIAEKNEIHTITLSTWILENGVRVGDLHVIYNMRTEYGFLKLLFFFMAVADGLGVLLSILAGFLLSRRVLRPIDSLTKTARQISVSDLSRRVPVNSADDELARLAVTFNEMIGRLEQAFIRQSQFVSDASHELRTPLAVIKGYADLIEMWAGEDPKALAESVAAIQKEATGMTGLIEDLLLLARADSGNLRILKEPVDLAGFVEEIVLESNLIDPKHSFSWQVDVSRPVWANRKLLKQAVRALVDNAIKYTPENGQIEIAVKETNKLISITVKDTGIGISEGEIAHLFDRFYRVDKDRAREKGGSGLGLAIVKQIVEAHGGSVKIKNNAGPGISATLLLP